MELSDNEYQEKEKKKKLTDIEYQQKVVDEVKRIEKSMENKPDMDNREKINPLVVALLVDSDGNETFSYRSESLDGDHAEFNMFMHKQAGKDHSKDTLYVSLEPCNHESRLNNISCSELIVKARIKKVFIGCFDPDILVRGCGYAYLKEKGVDVELFAEKYQKELIDANWPFFSDKLFKNENSRRFKNEYENMLSKEAMAFYLLINNNEITEYIEEKIKKKSESKDLLYEFYETCIKKKYIYNTIENGKRKVSADLGFDIAFFKNPSINIKGAYIKVIDNHISETESEKFDGPLIIAYYKAYEYIISIVKKINSDKKMEWFIRELVANAVFHKDYNSYAPVIVKIFEDRIEITNPCKREFIDINYLNKYEMPTNPINGCLTEIAMDMHLIEGQGKGEETLKMLSKDYTKKPYELICNILKVTIPL